LNQASRLTSPPSPRRRLGITLLVALLVAGCGTKPTDAALIQRFARDSSDYRRVVGMLAHDSAIGTIAPGFLWSIDKPFHDASPADVGITNERLADYRRTLRRLGVARLDRWSGGRVMFGIWGSGFGGNTRHKGIAWIEGPAIADRYRHYKEIQAPWYLFED
jgi:hypothetical protein